MAKPHATRTYAPLQFEALEPHRFEDLVRGLLHDFKDWEKIEATGRGGADAGFDARAFEKRVIETNTEESSEDDEEPTPSEGNLWMIQCKRQKTLTAAAITSIIQDGVKKESPPYGYILAAPVDFTKKSYDAFRAALIECGVTEFHVWGRAELEDMLYQPKNDYLLFAFFGISLVSKRRTRVSEVCQSVNNKNKLYKVLGAPDHNGSINTHVLIRDLNDSNYPNKKSYKDFEKKPRWKEFIAVRYYPEGVRFEKKKHFAYVNTTDKTWDMVSALDLVPRQAVDDKTRDAEFELRKKVEDFWEHLPNENKAYYELDGLINYSSFAFIDREGDTLYKFPHLFVDFDRPVFDGYWEYVIPENGSDAFRPSSDYKKIEFFPKEFSEPSFGTVHRDKTVTAPSWIVYRLRHGEKYVIFVDAKNEYDFLKPRDVIYFVSETGEQDLKEYAEITHRYKGKIASLYKKQPDVKGKIEQFMGREMKPKEEIVILELKRTYDFQLDKWEKKPNRPKL